MLFNHKELWNVSYECKSLILSLTNKLPNKRPTPIDALKSFWFEDLDDKNKEAQFSNDDKQVFIERMKHCINMTPLEKVLRRSISKKAISKNIE